MPVMAPSNEPPKQPNSLQRFFALIGPYPFLGCAGLSAAAHYHFRHDLHKDVERTFKSDTDKMIWKQLSRYPGKGLNSRGFMACVVTAVALVPWVFPGAWYADRCQRKVGEWEHWQNKPPRTNSAQAGAPSSAPSNLAAESGAQEDVFSPRAVALQQATDTPQLSEESTHAKFERAVARFGYDGYMLSCGAFALLDVGIVQMTGSQRNPGHLKLLRKSPAVYTLATFLASMLVTTPIPVYVWWCRRNIAQRDLAALPASQQSLESGKTGVRAATGRDTGYSVDEAFPSTRRDEPGEADDDWSWDSIDDRAAGREKEDRDAKAGGRRRW